MSKIYDALRKARGEGPEPDPREGTPSLRSPIPMESRGSSDPAQPDPAESTTPETWPAEGPEHQAPSAPVPGDRTEEGDDYPGLSRDFNRELANLRANLDHLLPDLPRRVVLFTGSIPGEGASTVAARFAQLVAEDGRTRTVLVDADFRNQDPRAIELVPAGEGLAGVFVGRKPLSQALRPTQMPGLDVLPSEGVDENSYRICSEKIVPATLQEIRGRYQYSILDSAPVLSAPETAVLAGMVDGVVLVVRAGRTKREVVLRSLERLRKYRARVLGVVMNRQQYVIPEFIYRRL